MAMLRASSYRRLFEGEPWSRPGGFSRQCGTQALRPVPRGGGVACVLEPDFAAAHAVNREGVRRFGQERSIIAALNDRLATLIDVARCLEEENEVLQVQLTELEERLGTTPSSSTHVSVACPTDLSLETIIDRLRSEKEQILCDTEELKKELQHMQMKYDKVVEQQALIQREREDVAVEVDAVTTDCLALREQVAVYEEQLAMMERQQEQKVESLVGPVAVDKTAPSVALRFPSIDITPAIVDIKDYYCQLAESLQFHSRGPADPAVTLRGEEEGQPGKLPAGKVKDISKVSDVGLLKEQVAELQKQAAVLEKRGEELEAEIEEKTQAHPLELEELEGCICRLQEEQAYLQAQMEEQTLDYEELLQEKMALDIEIAAYRGLVEEEENRLCCI